MLSDSPSATIASFRSTIERGLTIVKQHSVLVLGAAFGEISPTTIVAGNLSLILCYRSDSKSQFCQSVCCLSQSSVTCATD